VSAETQRRNPKVRAEDTATILLRHASGAVSQVECTYENRRTEGLDLEVEIECEAGGITLTPDGGLLVTTRNGTRREAAAAPEIAWATPPFHVVQESVVATCRHVLGCVRDGRPAETSIDDNLKTYALVEAAYESAATGTSAAPPAISVDGPSGS
jgi:predicted dehydrogenase